jgi:gas vesicle protein
MNDRTWDRLSGIAIGAMLGFGAGILLAPSSGEDMRANIKNRAKDSLDQLKTAVSDLQKTVREQSAALFRHETELSRVNNQSEPGVIDLPGPSNPPS